jgi:hypothetical protein
VLLCCRAAVLLCCCCAAAAVLAVVDMHARRCSGARSYSVGGVTMGVTTQPAISPARHVQYGRDAVVSRAPRVVSCAASLIYASHV